MSQFRAGDGFLLGILEKESGKWLLNGFLVPTFPSCSMCCIYPSVFAQASLTVSDKVLQIKLPFLCIYLFT